MTSPADLKMTIGDLLYRQADRFGDRDALVHVDWDLRYTWSQFRDECDYIARGLMALGISKGDHVALWATNYPEWVVAQFATAQIGAVLVTVNPAYRTHELEYLLRQSDAAALMLIGNFRSSDYVGMLGEVVPELSHSMPGQLQSEKLPGLRNVIFIPPHDGSSQECQPGMFAWADLRALGVEITPAALALRQADCHPDDVICIMYTSGTTGNPKGVMLTHHNLVANATYTREGLQFTEEDRLCIPVPFYHCFGSVLGTLCCAAAAAAMVVPSEYFDPGKALVAVEKEHCTAIHGVPTMFIAELEHPDFDQFDLGSLRTGIMAGSPCPIEVMRQVIDRMGCVEMTVGYGLTEAAPIITLTRSDDTIERRVSTVGTAIPYVDVKIVDPETGEEMSVGEQGELCSRSFMNMKGYYKMPEATEAAIDTDAWLHTGDLATVDSDGYFKITGRSKDMIIRGGENVYPREIEEFLYTNPKVADVQVIGIPDQRFGEEIMAWVLLRAGRDATEDEIRGLLPRTYRPLQGAPLRQIRLRVPHDRYRQNPKIRHAGYLHPGVATGRCLQRRDRLKRSSSLNTPSAGRWDLWCCRRPVFRAGSPNYNRCPIGRLRLQHLTLSARLRPIVLRGPFPGLPVEFAAELIRNHPYPG